MKGRIRMLISDVTSTALDELYGSFFDLNATLDRAVSIMLNNWAMPQASDIIHQKVAHAAPVYADLISEIKDNYNVPSVRPAVHEDSREYENLGVMFQTVLYEFKGVYEMIKKVIDIAMKNGDVNVVSDLVIFMSKFNKFFGMIVTLSDKANQMPEMYDAFDRHITSWGIDGFAPLSEKD